MSGYGAAIMDEPVRVAIAIKALLEAELVAATIPGLCEVVWVLTLDYKSTPTDVIVAVRKLTESAAVQVDRPVFEAALAVLEQGGDFGDSVIALEGGRESGLVFASVDRDAVKLIEQTGQAPFGELSDRRSGRVGQRSPENSRLGRYPPPARRSPCHDTRMETEFGLVSCRI